MPREREAGATRERGGRHERERRTSPPPCAPYHPISLHLLTLFRDVSLFLDAPLLADGGLFLHASESALSACPSPSPQGKRPFHRSSLCPSVSRCCGDVFVYKCKFCGGVARWVSLAPRGIANVPIPGGSLSGRLSHAESSSLTQRAALYAALELCLESSSLTHRASLELCLLRLDVDAERPEH